MKSVESTIRMRSQICEISVICGKNKRWESLVRNKEEMKNDCSNDICDYLKNCNVKTIEDLSDEQILEWARTGKMGLQTVFSTDVVEFGMFGKKPDKKKAVELLKQAILESKEFYCSYIERESSNGPVDAKDNDSFYMGIC